MKIARIKIAGTRTAYAVVERDHYRIIKDDIFGDLDVTDEKIPQEM